MKQVAVLVMNVFIFFGAVRARALPFDQLQFETAQTVVGQCSHIATIHILAMDYSRDLTHYYIRLSSTWQTTTPQIYLGAAFHGDEGVTAEAALDFVKLLCTDSRLAQRLLQTADIIVQPVVNPFGLRNGTRLGMGGIDPNRDFPIPSRGQFSSFSGQDSRVIDRIMQSRKIIASLAMHSGTEAVFYPNGFTRTPPAKESQLKSLAVDLANVMGITKVSPSYVDYPTMGEFSDYMLYSHGAIPLTLEISKEKNPSFPILRQKIIQRAILGIIEFVQNVSGQAHF